MGILTWGKTHTRTSPEAQVASTGTAAQVLQIHSIAADLQEITGDFMWTILKRILRTRVPGDTLPPDTWLRQLTEGKQENLDAVLLRFQRLATRMGIGDA